MTRGLGNRNPFQEQTCQILLSNSNYSRAVSDILEWWDQGQGDYFGFCHLSEITVAPKGREGRLKERFVNRTVRQGLD